MNRLDHRPLRRPRRVAPVLIAVCAFAISAPTQSGSWSTEFAPPGLAGRVFSFATWRGHLYAGGHHFAPIGGPFHSIARFDGFRWRDVGGGLTAAVNFTTRVRGLTVWNDSLVAAGSFAFAGGMPANNIARWDGTTWAPLGTGLELSYGTAEVFALAVYGTDLFATGDFDTAGGIPVKGIARWDGSGWHALGSGLEDNVNSRIGVGRALLVHSSRLWIGGEFDRAGGTTANSIATWDGTAYAPVGAGTQWGVSALAAHAGEVVAAGPFQFGNLTEFVGAWDGFAWHALGRGPDRAVVALTVYQDDLYAGGLFGNVGPSMARWDGSAWSDVGGVGGVFSGTLGSQVRALHAFGTELIVGGEFSYAGLDPGALGPHATTNVAAFDGNDWRGLGPGLGCDGTPAALVPFRGGMVMAGNFGQAGDVVAPHVAFFDGDRWLPLGRFDGPIVSAVAWNDDLIVSGRFRNVDGRPLQGIARWDGTGWQPFGSLYAVPLAVYRGQVFAGADTSLSLWNGTAFVTVASVPAGVIGDLHVHGGALYVSTESAFQHEILRWDGTSLTSIGRPNSFVHCLGSHGTDLVAGGRFTSVSGTAAAYIARFDGSQWRAFAQPLNAYSVDSLAELDGILYAGVNGDPRGFYLSYDGATWRALGGPAGVPQVQLADRTAGNLFVAGHFSAAGTVSTWNVARYDTQAGWRDLWHGKPAGDRRPLLIGRGDLLPSTPFLLRVEGPPHHAAGLALGGSRIDWPLFGGVLVPSPDLVLTLVGDGSGVATLSFPFPPGLRASDLYLQAWLFDARALPPWTATNALRCRVP